MSKSLEDMFKSTTFAPAFERERRTRHDDEGKAEEAVTLKYKDEVGNSQAYIGHMQVTNKL